MNDNSRTLLDQFIRYHNLLLRYHHHAHRSHGSLGDPMRGQGRILSILKMKPEITQKDLAYLLDMRGQSLSELLSKLEGKGYITRTASEEDRRVMVIRLTEEGKQAVPEEERPDFETPFQCLSGEERETLKGLLERLIASMEEYLGGEAPRGRSQDFGGHGGRGHDWGGRGRPGCGHEGPPYGIPDWDDSRDHLEQIFSQIPGWRMPEKPGGGEE